MKVELAAMLVILLINSIALSAALQHGSLDHQALRRVAIPDVQGTPIASIDASKVTSGTYQVKPSAPAVLGAMTWAVYDVTVKNSADRPNHLYLLLNLISELGDPDLYLWIKGSQDYIDIDNSAFDDGFHELKHTIEWTVGNVTLSEINFQVGVHVWGDTACTFALAAVTSFCPAQIVRGSGSHIDDVYPRACGNPEHPHEQSRDTDASHVHGSCTANGICVCNQHTPTFEWDFVLGDCSGLAAPTPIYPGPAPGAARLEHLSVSEISDVYYNISVLDEVYEVSVELALETDSGNLAGMSIGIDQYVTGEDWEADFKVSREDREARLQRIEFSRSPSAANPILTSGEYVIRVQWIRNESNTADGNPTQFSLAVAANNCPAMCSGTIEQPELRGTCNKQTHTCTCKSEYASHDCSVDVIPLTFNLIDVNGLTTQKGKPFSSSLGPQASELYRISPSATHIDNSIPAEFVVSVVAGRAATGTDDDAELCNSIPKLSIAQGSPGRPSPHAHCQWKQTSDAPLIWTVSKSMSSFEFNVTNDLYVVVLAAGDTDMPFNISTRIVQHPSTSMWARLQTQLSSTHESGISTGGVVALSMGGFGVLLVVCIAMFYVGRHYGFKKHQLHTNGHHSLLGVAATSPDEAKDLQDENHIM